MTWYFSPSGTVIDVYDHTGTEVANELAHGGTWAGTPDIVYQVMTEEIGDAATNGDITYAVEALADAIADNIEEGQP